MEIAADQNIVYILFEQIVVEIDEATKQPNKQPKFQFIYNLINKTVGV